MARSTRAQKVERLNVAYTLLAQGMTASDVALQLSQRFGLSRRQSYRYLQDARAMGQPAEPTEALIPITIKIPDTVQRRLCERMPEAVASQSGRSLRGL